MSFYQDQAAQFEQIAETIQNQINQYSSTLDASNLASLKSQADSLFNLAGSIVSLDTQGTLEQLEADQTRLAQCISTLSSTLKSLTTIEQISNVLAAAVMLASAIASADPTAISSALMNAEQVLSGIGSISYQPNPSPRRTDAVPASQVKSAGSAGEAPFSESANSALKKARQLADQSGRTAVSSSCLLFGLAEDNESSSPTSLFVRQLLMKNSNYSSALSDFLSQPATSSSSSAGTTQGLHGPYTPNAAALLEFAANIAQRVSKGSRTVHTRHLFAALLVAPGATGTPFARSRMAQHGYSVPSLATEFLSFLGSNFSADDQSEWNSILAVSDPNAAEATPSTPSTSSDLPPEAASKQTPSSPPTPQSPFVTGTPGYTSEFCGLGGNGPVADNLGVEDLAHRFAELIVLRETRLPLAIGLFGNWGSGKSHFMNLIDRDIKALADKKLNPPSPAGQGEGADDIWCREMVPIYFNAWHYSDANLWASLVAEVFDALFARLQPEPDQLGYLEKRLREAGGVTALASEEANQASKVVAQANEALQAAKAESANKSEVVLALKNGLATLLPELNSDENRARLVELLGIAPEIATLSDFNLKRSELTTFGGRVKGLWRRAFAPEGRRARFAWLAGALIALAISYLAQLYFHQYANKIAGFGLLVRAALISLIACLGWLAPVFKQMHNALAQLEKWQKKAEDAQANMPRDPRVIKAEAAKASAEATAVAAEAALAAAKSVESQLTQSIEDLSPQRRLNRFIEARARSADYRGQLGLVSLARRDFTELSRIFADSEALNQRVKDMPDQAERLKKLSATVDRVVLFIDDLDRCDPEKVVDVLQAVHLLLAYPLFVVVVGVDQRCLRQSLRMRFRGLLTSEEPIDHPPVNGRSEEDEIPATPLDYLEKIFHIPFHLPPMSQKGFGDLVENLTELPVYPKATSSDSSSGPSVSSSAQQAPATGQPPAPDGASGESHPSISANAAPATAQSSPKVADGKTAESVRAIGSVPLERWERDALKEYFRLIRTPRGVIRLLNTYRLVRAGIPVQEWDGFRGLSNVKGESGLAMLLLAVAAGEPSIARSWFRLLRAAGSGESLSSNDAAGIARPEWNEFCKLYGEAIEKTPATLIPTLVGKWLDRVERFTF